MRTVFLILSLSTSIHLVAQDKSDYIGSWYFSGIYTQAIFTLSKEGNVDWIGSGCTYRNEKRNGSWSYEGEHIVIQIFKDTFKVKRIERKLISYPVDSNDLIESRGYKKTVWSSKFGLKLLRKRDGRLRKRKARREDRNL